MYRQVFSFGGLVLLAGAVALATPGSSQAQHSGGHGGGGHAGGGHVSGGHFDSGHFNGGHFGGFNNGRGRFGFPNARSGFFYPYYGYYYNDYPYYGGDYSYSYTYPDTGSGAVYDSRTTTANYQSLYPPTIASTQPDTQAHMTVRVPADARIWFEDHATASTGAVREFSSPPLPAGGRYTYNIRATWTENGHDVTQTRQIDVTAGARVDVEFPVKPEPTGQPSIKAPI